MIWALLTTLALAQDTDARKTRPEASSEATEAVDGRKTRPTADAQGTEDGDAVDARKTRPVGPDRSAPPEVAPPAIIDQPEPSVHELRPGLTAWHVRVPSVRKVEIAVIPRIGALDLLDVEDGTGEATGWMMDVATETWDSTAFEIFEDMNDLDVTSGMNLHDGLIGLSVPKEDLKRGLRAMGDVLRNPSFNGKDLKLYQREIAIWYGVLAAQSQRQVASSALTHTWYPPDHPYGTRTNVAALENLKGKDLAAIHERWLASAPAHVIVVGDVPWKQLEPDLKKALEGVGVEGAISEHRPFEPSAGTRVVAVDMPGQEQVAIQYRLDGPHLDDEDRIALWTANWILGGHFLSRLNANLREDKGFTYGSRSSLWSGVTRGSVTISVDVKAENTAETVTEIGVELARMRDAGVTADEIAAAYASEVSTWNDTRQSAESALGFYRSQFNRGFSVPDARSNLEAIGALTPEDVQQAAEKWFAVDAPQNWVFVGSRDALEPELEALGLEAEWTTPRAAISGTLE